MRWWLVAVPLAVFGCTAAPAHAIAGSFFPSWLICAIGGVAAAAVIRQLLVVADLETHLLLPPLTYAAIALGACLLLWLLWSGG